MTKKNVHGSVVFTASVPTYLPPAIVDEFIGDDGEKHYALSNGNTTLASRYNSLWHPKPGVINWKAKGDNPDRTRIS